MSKAAIRAPSAARVSATARPWPCAAPVMKATLPANSPLPIFIKIFVEVHFEDIVDNIGGNHQPRERGKSHHLLIVEQSSDFRVKVIRHPIAVAGDCAAELNEGFAFFVENQGIRVFSP